jgi:REP element-mobilizing transposase RayT
MLRYRPGQSALRRGRASLSGQAYLLTTVCARRRRLFAEFEVACAAAKVLAEPRLWRGGDLLAWVLMPDHWHGLLQLQDEASLSTIMQRAKANSSRELARAFAFEMPVWQPGFHDRALRSDDDFGDAARYLIANPLRAGLAATLADYPFWDSRWGFETLDCP